MKQKIVMFNSDFIYEINREVCDLLSTLNKEISDIEEPDIEHQNQSDNSNYNDYNGNELSKLLETECVNGWYCHQIQPTKWKCDSFGKKLLSAIIILHNTTNN